MKTRTLLSMTAAVIGVFLCGACVGMAAGKTRKRSADTSLMNLMLIVVEDWSSFAVGCYGNPVVQTPNVDALAREGVRFDRAYCQGTVCNPSRASLVTGLRPDSTRVFGNADSPDQLVPEGAPSMAEIVRRRADFAACLGKLVHRWDESERFASGYDLIEYTHSYDNITNFGGVIRMTPPGPGGPVDVEMECLSLPDKETAARLKRLHAEREAKIAAGAPNTWELRKPFQQLLAEQVGDSGLPEERMEDGRIARSAAGLLDQLARSGKQFFLTVGLYSTHTPLLAPRKYVDLYPSEEMTLTPATREKDQRVPDVARRFGQNYDIFNGLYPEFGPTAERRRQAIAAYYACASYVDAQIGIILDALQQTGLESNTMVILFSDHGFQLGEHGCWSKFTLFEQSTRVPLIVRIPGMKTGGKACDRFVELVDVLPTICDLWGLEPDDRFEGLSFVPLLADPERRWKEAAFSTVPIRGLGRSVRTERYRYAEYRKSTALPIVEGEPVARELYDLEADPYEQRNLVDDPAYAIAVAEHAALLRGGWRAALP